jgi:serine/threonine-protein kinase
MSPEQILGEHTDARGDLFAVGVILYEMVSARRPFEADDNRTTAQRIRHEPPAPLDAEVTQQSPLLERIVQRALSKLPSDRFADAGEMLLLLDMALAEYQASPREALLHGLREANVIERGPTRAPRPPVRHLGLPLSRAALVYGAVLVLFLAGVFSINHVFARAVRDRVDEATELPLKPPEAAALRVIARPWADVFVDGHKVETTPFATPIPLRPGVHYLRFEHPNSAPVPRRIELLPGQNLLLEVDMPLPIPTHDPNELLIPPKAERDGGRSP